MRRSTARRAFVLVIDACGAGALPDAAAYGDEGDQHAGPSRAGARRAAPARPGRARPRLDPRPAGRAAEPRPGDPRPPGAVGTGQGLDHRPLGADGGDARPPTADLPGGLPRRAPRPPGRRDGPRGDLQQARQRPERDRGVRRGAPEQRRPDPLHLPGLRAAAGRPHGPAARAGRSTRPAGEPAGRWPASRPSAG